jgi:predicted hotdog family 3-hydroxylacyl-ACP dehydratase
MIEKEELLSLIPHRGRMLLLDGVKWYNLQEQSLEAESRITEDCLFYDSAAAGIPAWVGFEFLAQAVSALTGIGCRERGEPSKIGFILGVSQVQIRYPFFKTGSIIAIKVKEIERMASLSVFFGEIFLEDEKVLEGKLTVMDVDDEKAEAMKKGRNSVG